MSYLGLDPATFDIHPLATIVGLGVICIVCAVLDWLAARRRRSIERTCWNTYALYADRHDPESAEQRRPA